MTYNFNGKIINIPDKEIENLMKSLELSKEEAIDTWLCDHDYEEDEEQIELDEKAKKVKISHEIAQKTEKKERKPAIKAVSDEKKALFDEIFTNLQSIYGENAQNVRENKEISIKIGEISFKVDVVQHRTKKS